MTKRHLLSKTLMLLPAMLVLVMATSAMSAIKCDTGYADCDGTPSNKCEINIQTDVKNCGACGKACSLCNATSSCVNGTCKLQSCTSPWVDRDGNASNGCESAWCGCSLGAPPMYQQGYSAPTPTGGWVCTWRCPSGKTFQQTWPNYSPCGNWYERDPSCPM